MYQSGEQNPPRTMPSSTAAHSIKDICNFLFIHFNTICPTNFQHSHSIWEFCQMLISFFLFIYTSCDTKCLMIYWIQLSIWAFPPFPFTSIASSLITMTSPTFPQSWGLISLRFSQSFSKHSTTSSSSHVFNLVLLSPKPRALTITLWRPTFSLFRTDVLRPSLSISLVIMTKGFWWALAISEADTIYWILEMVYSLNRT